MKNTLKVIGFFLCLISAVVIIVAALVYITPEKKLGKKERILPTNTTIKVKNFDVYGVIVDSSYLTTGKYYTIRYQISTGEIINQGFHDWELDTIPWINSK